VTVPGGITPTAGLAVSPDGNRLVWSTCRQSTYVARVGAEDPVEPLSHGDWIDFYPRRIDDGHVLIESERSGVLQLWSYNLTARTVTPLATPGTHSGSASPDGKSIVFLDPRRGPGVFLAPITGGAPRQLTRAQGDDAPQFAFDGKRIVFERKAGATAAQLFVVEAGGQPKPLAPPGWVDAAPSPVDDTLVVLDTTLASGVRVMRTDLTGAPARPVAGLEAGDWRMPRISPDGKRLLLVHKRAELVEVALDGDSPPATRWAAKTQSIATAEYAPDGHGFIASLASFDGDLWLAEGRFP
jgi:Tol biopolymer transport system component